MICREFPCCYHIDDDNDSVIKHYQKHHPKIQPLLFPKKTKQTIGSGDKK